MCGGGILSEFRAAGGVRVKLCANIARVCNTNNSIRGDRDDVDITPVILDDLGRFLTTQSSRGGGNGEKKNKTPVTGFIKVR